MDAQKRIEMEQQRLADEMSHLNLPEPSPESTEVLTGPPAGKKGKRSTRRSKGSEEEEDNTIPEELLVSKKRDNPQTPVFLSDDEKRIVKDMWMTLWDMKPRPTRSDVLRCLFVLALETFTVRDIAIRLSTMETTSRRQSNAKKKPQNDS